MAFLTQDQLETMGFKSLGKNVLISDKASLYGVSRMDIGDHTRIDDFCVLSAGEGGFSIGRHVHIAINASLIGAGRITVEDFVGISARTAVYSSNDDYSGAFLTNPTVPAAFTNVTHKPVHFGRHALVGAGCVVLPGVTIGDGVSVGAMSLVNKDCAPFGIYVGTPAQKVKERKRDLLELEQRFLASQA